MIARATTNGKTGPEPRGTACRASFALLLSVLLLPTSCGCGPVGEEVRLCSEGEEHEQKGDQAKALECYTQAIAANESYAEAYSHRGVLYVCQEEFQKGVDDLTKALALNVNDDTGNRVYWRGVAYRGLGEYKMALADFEAAISKMKFYRAVEPRLFDTDNWSERTLDSYYRARDETLEALQEQRKP